MKVIRTADAARALAELLNGQGRRRPVVVVTTPAGQSHPWIDAREVEAQVGALADVYLVPTGPHSWTFSEHMPPLTQVYGGAGRVYPVGHEWASNPHRSPLRFAYSAREGEQATLRLIDDAMAMAAMAGLKSEAPARTRRKVTGVVSGILAERALVRVGREWASVSPALAVASLPIERVLSEGTTVTGWLDDAGMLDIREMVLPPAVALGSYPVRSVVLAEVGEVHAASAEVFLHPQAPVVLAREEITSNERDDLRSLLSSGDVVAVRVVRTGPQWRLTMLDIDDDEDVVPATSLVRDGPPWLAPVEEVALEFVPPPPVVTDETFLLASGPDVEIEADEPVAAEEPPPATPPAPRAAPSPLLLDRRRPRPGPASAPPPPSKPAVTAPPSPSPTVGQMSLQITALKEQVRTLKSEVGRLQVQTEALVQERRSLLQETTTLRARVDHQDHIMRDQRSRLRKTRQSSSPEGEAPVFADREQGFRHEVTAAWARRTPVAEQFERPLPDYTIGADFLSHVDALEGINPAKVADVVFEIVTGRADQLAGREIHQLRETESGGSAPVVRPEDGATAWRANLQTRSASARRIHFWRLRDGSVELWHVGLHDDVPQWR